MTAKLLVVGGGRMGGALLAGLVKSGWAKPQELAVLEPDPERGASLSSTHGGLNVLSQAEPGVVGEDGGAVLAVKPDVAASACRSIALSGAKRVLSIVAGLPTDRMEGWLPEGTVVVRAMPNTAVLVGAGVSAVSGGSRAKSNDLAWAEDILSAVGTVIRLPESLLDSVTGLSGSGPAYVFFIAEAMIEAGVISGLTREVSRTLVVETILGAGKLLADTGASPESLRADVTSPGGTTAAGLHALESRAVRSAFLEAVASAVERSRELSR